MSPRNRQLPSARQPLLDQPGVQLQNEHTTGALPFLHPTHASFLLNRIDDVVAQDESPLEPPKPAATAPLPAEKLHWRSRDNRKGRHALAVPADHKSTPAQPVATSWSAIRANLWRMCTVFPWWDVSWCIAVFFVVGCLVFIICALFYWLPLVAPESEFDGGEKYGGGITSFIGGWLFQIGGVLLVFEAANENQTGCFGWAVENAFHRVDDTSDPAHHVGTHHHAFSGRVLATPKDCDHHHASGLHRTAAAQRPVNTGRTWSWWPTWHEMRTHYFHEIGFLSSIILAIGVTLFTVTSTLALPGVYDNLGQKVRWGVYWMTYLVGGVCFVVSAVLSILETQKDWYTPSFGVLGWHIGVWNLIGGIGWVLAPCFGYVGTSWAEYQTELTLLWATVAYLIGSLLLWYEAVDKYPVVRNKCTS